MGRSKRLRYTNGILDSITEKGLTTTYKRDNLGRPVETILPGGASHKFTWDDHFRMASHTRSDGVTTHYNYLKNLDLIESVEIMGLRPNTPPKGTSTLWTPESGAKASPGKPGDDASAQAGSAISGVTPADVPKAAGVTPDVQRDANPFGGGDGGSATMNAFRLVAMYEHEPNGVLKSVLKPLGDGQAELTTYKRAYKGDGTVKVTVAGSYRKLLFSSWDSPRSGLIQLSPGQAKRSPGEKKNNEKL